ncbi:hypothetical protein HZA76_00685 [Candidatus Roizmanbacteria bacterium]|nr:hypothetical protein [Candidatus Roizmanbacteria bacterium]
MALCLRTAEADFNVTQAEMEACVVSTQQMAANANATVFEGSELTLDSYQAWYVWCSDATTVDAPTDVSMVFDHLPTGPGRIWIQNVFDPNVPARSDDTWTGCNGKFWATAVH